jgi:hypothetical protein
MTTLTRIEQPAAMTKEASLSAKIATISAKVAAIPVEERFALAVKLAHESDEQPTDDQSIEFAKLFFGPDIVINM